MPGWSPGGRVLVGVLSWFLRSRRWFARLLLARSRASSCGPRRGPCLVWCSRAPSPRLLLPAPSRGPGLPRCRLRVAAWWFVAALGPSSFPCRLPASGSLGWLLWLSLPPGLVRWPGGGRRVRRPGCRPWRGCRLCLGLGCVRPVCCRRVCRRVLGGLGRVGCRPWRVCCPVCRVRVGRRGLRARRGVGGLRVVRLPGGAGAVVVGVARVLGSRLRLLGVVRVRCRGRPARGGVLVRPWCCRAAGVGPLGARRLGRVRRWLAVGSPSCCRGSPVAWVLAARLLRAGRSLSRRSRAGTRASSPLSGARWLPLAPAGARASQPGLAMVLVSSAPSAVAQELEPLCRAGRRSPGSVSTRLVWLGAEITKSLTRMVFCAIM